MASGREPLAITHGRPALILAPMEGITDAPMRALLSEVGGFTHVVSEFIRVSQDPLPRRVFRQEIPESSQGYRTDSGQWVQPQLLGGDPARIAASAVAAIETGAPGIDLNFGCPAQTVNRNDGGATLLKDPRRVEAVVRAVRDSVPAALPVSAKLRLGWDDPSAILETVKRAEAGGASWITIHARTKTNGYQPPAFWEWIARAKPGVAIPIVANGDIWNLEDFRRCREITGCEHFMIGRSALADPWLGLRIARELGIAPGGSSSRADLPDPRDPFAWISLLEKFAVFSERYSARDREDGRYCARRVKQWLKYSEKTYGTNWFTAVKQTQTLPELFEVLRSFSTVRFDSGAKSTAISP